MNVRSVKLLIGIIILVSVGMVVTLLSYDRALTRFTVWESQCYQKSISENTLSYLKRCGKSVSKKKDKYGRIVEHRRFYSKRLEEYILKNKIGREDGFKLFKYGYVICDSNGIVVAKHGNILKLQKNKYIRKVSYNDVGVCSYDVNFYFEKENYIEYKSFLNYLPAFLFLLVFIILYVHVLRVIINADKLKQLKTDYVNYMTHELKTPVSSIYLATQMLQDIEIGKKPETSKRILDVISDETKRLKFQINKALQVSLMSKDKSNFDFEKLRVNDVLKNVMKSFALRMESYGGSINCDLRAEYDSVYASNMHLTNLVSNLIDNAVKYRDKKRPLIVRITSKNIDDSFLLTICDNGIGIKKEYLDKIFDKYFRVHADNAKNIDGFGLGLPYVKLVVESHGGTISVDSKINVGTKFIIKLPTIKKKI